MEYVDALDALTESLRDEALNHVNKIFRILNDLTNLDCSDEDRIALINAFIEKCGFVRYGVDIELNVDDIYLDLYGAASLDGCFLRITSDFVYLCSTWFLRILDFDNLSFIHEDLQAHFDHIKERRASSNLVGGALVRLFRDISAKHTLEEHLIKDYARLELDVSVDELYREYKADLEEFVAEKKNPDLLSLI